MRGEGVRFRRLSRDSAALKMLSRDLAKLFLGRKGRRYLPGSGCKGCWWAFYPIRAEDQ